MHRFKTPTKFLPASLGGISLTCLAWSLVISCEKPRDFETEHVRLTGDDCVSCHRPDYEIANKPLHKGLYPENCWACHDNQRWTPANCLHPFPLDGRHALTACWQCHVGTPPVFSGTPKECLGCHLNDYQSSPFPGHAAFQETCRDCHTTGAWEPATGPHPEAAFPTATGVHQYPCLDCHNPTLGLNSALNTARVGCHDGVHERALLDPIHVELGLSDYPTGDAAPNFCLDCHPKGER
jgi:hypothetical protein